MKGPPIASHRSRPTDRVPPTHASRLTSESISSKGNTPEQQPSIASQRPPPPPLLSIPPFSHRLADPLDFTYEKIKRKKGDLGAAMSYDVNFALEFSRVKF